MTWSKLTWVQKNIAGRIETREREAVAPVWIHRQSLVGGAMRFGSILVAAAAVVAAFLVYIQPATAG